MTGATVSYPQPRLRLGRWALGATAVLFGVATLVEGGHVLFGGPAAREEAGNVVSFVLLFNFGAGFAYVLAGLAALLGRSWATWIARALAVATLVVFVAFGVHVLAGGAFELRTVIAMTLRSGFWVTQALLLPRVLERTRETKQRNWPQARMRRASPGGFPRKSAWCWLAREARNPA